MGRTGLSFVRTLSAAVLTSVLLAGCGDDGTSADDPASGDETGEEVGDGTSDEDTSDATSDEDEADDAGGAGEAEDDASGNESDDTPGADGGADEGVEMFEMTITDGAVSPPFDTYEVALGANVRIEITSDVADDVHLHGYDLELALEPGEPGVLEFTADIEGRFELETHDLGFRLLQLEVG